MGPGQKRKQERSQPLKHWARHLTFPFSTLLILSWWLSLPSLQTLHVILASSRGGQAKKGDRGTHPSVHRLVDLRPGSSNFLTRKLDIT